MAVQVIKNFSFLRMCFSVTFLYYVVTVIQFWFTDYLITVMHMEAGYVFMTFGLVSVTGPVMGVIFGGIVSTKLGGYNNTKSLYVTAILAFTSCLVAMPIPFMPPD